MSLTLLPAVDVVDGKAVRLHQGAAGSEKVYGTPLEAALNWQEQGAQWLHFVDLDAAFNRGSNYQLMAEVVKGYKNKSTDRGRAADKLKICFTVGANKIAKSGSRYFYIQVNSPSGTILGSNESFSSGSESVNYSTATHFIYDNKSVDICDFIAKVGKEFEKGTYKVTVYDDKLNQVGTTDLLLK